MSRFSFPAEWVTAALLLAMLSVWLEIALFVYLDRYTKKRYFRLWTVAWMFYSVYLGASFALQQLDNLPLLIMAQRAGLGVSALFLFAGSQQKTGPGLSDRVLGLGTIFLLAWSCVAAFLVRDGLWITIPVFVLLAAAGIYTALMYRRREKRTRGASLLKMGFLLWGLHLLAFPFITESRLLAAVAYLSSGAIMLVIILGMVVEHQVALFEHRYWALFDSASDAVFLLEAQTLKVIDANRAAGQLLGRVDLGTTAAVFLDFCADSSKKLIADLSQRVMAGGQLKTPVECALLRADGAVVTCEATASLVDELKGPALQFRFRDTTERKRTEQELHVKAAALAAATNAIVIGDAAGHIIWVNQAFTGLTGYTATEAFGRHIWFMKSENQQPAFYKEMWDTILHGRPWQGRLVNQHKDGRQYTEEMIITPVRAPDGRVTNFIAIKQNATRNGADQPA